MDNIKFAAVGDINLGGGINDYLKTENFPEPFKFVLPELINNDMVFGNLEGPFSERGNMRKPCAMSSPPKTANSLKEAGFNVLSLANNHTFDYGVTAFEDTTSILKQKNIDFFGAGRTLVEARKPAIKIINGISIGFLGYSWFFIESIEAKRDAFGTAPLERDMIIADVKKLRKETDIVVVSLHFGYVNEKYPLPSQRELCHEIIDAGATLILGHHPHVIQGIEEYKNGVIAYSLGDFIFPPEKKQQCEGSDAILFKCEISKKGIEKYSVYLITKNKNQLPEISPPENSLEKIKTLSKRFAEKDYAKFWKTNRIRADLPDATNNRIISRLIYRFYKSKYLCPFLRFF